jgi:zinc transport system permease protein
VPLLELLDYDFMRRALVAAVLVGVAAPLVGVFVVQRRLALIGDGLGHVATTGVATGLVTGRAPVAVALVVTVLAAVGVELIRLRGRATGDLALAVMFYGGIAGGVVIASQAEGGLAQLESYLFGAITTTSPADLAVFGVLATALVAVVVALHRELFLVSDDEEFARATGMPVTALNLLLVVLVAATVVLAMRVIGLLLVSALMVLPVATAQLVAGSFRRTLVLAAGLGLLLSVTGVAGSFAWDTPSGGTIVLLAIACFVLTLALVGARERWARRQQPVDAAARPGAAS